MNSVSRLAIAIVAITIVVAVVLPNRRPPPEDRTPSLAPGEDGVRRAAELRDAEAELIQARRAAADTEGRPPHLQPSPAVTTSPTGGDDGVAAYLDRLMAVPATRKYIMRIHRPDPGLPLVYVDCKEGVPDWQIEEIVRVITKGVHENSETGTATVIAQVDGITMVQGEYKIFSGAIEVKSLR